MSSYNDLQYVSIPFFHQTIPNRRPRRAYICYIKNKSSIIGTEYNEMNINYIIFDNSIDTFLIYINENDTFHKKGIVLTDYIKIEGFLYNIHSLDHDCNIIKVKLCKRSLRLMRHVVENYSKIPRCLKCLYTNKVINEKKIIDLTDEQIYLVHNFKMNQLKEIAIKNLVDLNKVENKTMKRSWARAITKTKKYGFNVFIVGIKKNKKHILNGQMDILLTIQSFL